MKLEINSYETYKKMRKMKCRPVDAHRPKNAYKRQKFSWKKELTFG